MYFVYILANPHPTSRVLYVGVTADLAARAAIHRARLTGFTARYNVTSLVHVEAFDEVIEAIEREKRIKG
jgi:putative endonuclease